MKPDIHVDARLTLFVLTILSAACSPPQPPSAPAAAPGPILPEGPAVAAGLPPVPSIDGHLHISVTHPTPLMVRPDTDSVFVYGSIGSGRAALAVNGIAIEVAPNGAFIAFVPRPVDDTLRLAASRGTERAEATVAYRPPARTAPQSAPETVDYVVPRRAVVVAGGDTLATGSDVSIGRATPTAPYRWFLPSGARLTITGERGTQVRARLDSSTEAWLDRSAVAFVDGPAPDGHIGRPSLAAAALWSDVSLPISGAPFRIVASDDLIEVTVHGRSAARSRHEAADEVVALVEIAPSGPDATAIRIYPSQAVWGFKAFYQQDGTLVVRVRKAPQIDPEAPLQSMRIAIDPGHPPGGATGPTGLREAEANLAISLRLAEELTRRGAQVLLTRSADVDVALGERVDAAVAWNADLLVSVHNNAFPEGVNPFLRHGTSSYYFHPFSAELARRVNAELVETTRIRDLGAISGNLALVRPTWMPSVLTESLFMPMPDQEAALQDVDFLDRLAEAHARGIERFLEARSRDGAAGGVGPVRP
jgi:N-acetylmuramoyl-L-alanine amidase